MKISVIIPAYNEEKTIGDCLKSLSHQSITDMEIVVVDDGSTDKTLSEIHKVNIECRVLKAKHNGAGAARNLGAKYAKGEIFVFVDADMTFDKNFIKNLVKPIINRSAVGTFSKDEYLLNSENIWARCWNVNRGFPQNKMTRKKSPDTQKVFRAILKREFDKAGGFNERAGYNDDWTLSERLGTEAFLAPQAIFYHKNPDSLKEVFIQSKWMAKRRYKLGAVGNLVALVRVSLPVSIIVGIAVSAAIFNFKFLIFKIVSDIGEFIGIVEYSLLGKVAK